MKLAAWLVPSFIVSTIAAASCTSPTVAFETGGSSGAGGMSNSSTSSHFLAASTSTGSSSFLAASSSTNVGSTSSTNVGSSGFTTSSTGGFTTSSTGGFTTSSTGGFTTSSTGSSGGAPTTCAQVDNTVGCCTSAGVLYFCGATTDPAPTQLVCATGTACGWNATATAMYYDCVAPPAAPDPSGTYPELCQ